MEHVDLVEWKAGTRTNSCGWLISLQLLLWNGLQYDSVVSVLQVLPFAAVNYCTQNFVDKSWRHVNKIFSIQVVPSSKSCYRYMNKSCHHIIYSCMRMWVFSCLLSSWRTAFQSVVTYLFNECIFSKIFWLFDWC